MIEKSWLSEFLVRDFKNENILTTYIGLKFSCSAWSYLLVGQSESQNERIQ